MSDDELIMAVPAANLPYHYGLSPSMPHLVDYAMATPDMFLPRGPLEKDPSRKQLVVYTVVRDPDTQKILAYYRPKKGAEARLHGMMSVGVGGHVNIDDYNAVVSVRPQAPLIRHVLRAAARRELDEELGPAAGDFRWLGAVNHDDTAVGSVHFGCVYSIARRATEIQPSAELLAPQWLALEEFAANNELRSGLEVWSQFIVSYLLGVTRLRGLSL